MNNAQDGRKEGRNEQKAQLSGEESFSFRLRAPGSPARPLTSRPSSNANQVRSGLVFAMHEERKAMRCYRKHEPQHSHASSFLLRQPNPQPAFSKCVWKATFILLLVLRIFRIVVQILAFRGEVFRLRLLTYSWEPRVPQKTTFQQPNHQQRIRSGCT